MRSNDQLLGDFRRAVGVGLAILDSDLDRQSGGADFDAAFYGFDEIGNDETVGFAKCRERPGLRADIADPEALRGMHGGCEYRTDRKRGACRH
jgi:hypothetical protein